MLIFETVKVKFKKQYRIKGFDYGANNTYFVGILTKNRVPHFGTIQNETFIASEIGNIAIENWKSIPEHFAFVVLDEFICMPNHFHGILEFSWHPRYHDSVIQNLADLEK